MGENIKTLIYVGCACLVVVIAYASRPAEEGLKTIVDHPEALFPKFKDPGKAARLEIVKVAADTGELQRFEVARDKKSGRWTIPSHGGYPADAEERMRDASVMFIDLTPIAIQTNIKEEHEKFGVVEPADNADTKGVGTLVNIEGRESDLAQLIIGKAVKGRQNQWFVRVPGKDPVYVAELNPEKLSTKFEDWIEKDLLKMNAWDIADVSLFDYTVLETLPPGTFMIDNRMQVDLGWDATKSEWNLKKLFSYRKGKPVPATLAEDEQLNAEKLNALKSAIDELEIVDVHRKPEGMGEDLRANAEFAKNRETQESLYEKGFLPLESDDQAYDIRSTNGEVHVGMKDGVEYILRFGNPIPGSDEKKLNRFMLVTAQFDESKFPMPERSSGAAPTQDNPLREDGTPDATPTGGTPPESPSGDAAPDSGGDAPPPGACQQDDSSAPDTGSSQPETNPALQPDEGAATDSAESDQQKQDKEYQRKVDERNDKIKKGKQHVRELNGRFADWYYVISEDVYKKVHLNRADIVKSKEGNEGTGLDSFRKLEEEGLRIIPDMAVPGGAVPGSSVPGGAFPGGK